MSKEAIAKVLSKYLPPPAVEACTDWVIHKNIHLRITRGRASKYGDYMPLPPGKGHRITVNHDLNAYAFLITFVHEVAHLHCFMKHGRRHEPHGAEWKAEFRRLLNEFRTMNIFPADIEMALAHYLRDPAASSCSDAGLSKALKKYDAAGPESVYHLEDLPDDAVFRLHQSKKDFRFRKVRRIRTRYQCLELRTNHVYFVSALAEVIHCKA